jgi:hypothetical protein
MRIIIGNDSPVDSEDKAVMLRLTRAEIERIKDTPDDHDLFIFHPSHWPESTGRRWAESKAGLINGKSHMVSMVSDDDEAVLAPDDTAQQDTSVAKVESAPEQKADATEESSTKENIKKPSAVSDDAILGMFGISTAVVPTEKSTVDVPAVVIDENDKESSDERS